MVNIVWMTILLLPSHSLFYLYITHGQCHGEDDFDL